MSAWDNKAVNGKDLQEKVLKPIAALIKACSTTANADKVYEVIATAFNDIVARVDGLENDGSVTKDDLQKYCKQRQAAKSSPSASSTAIAFIDTISQNENGDITATKKTVRSATTGQTGVVQLTNSTSSTSTTTAATPASVKSAYDLANGKLSPSGDGKDVTSTVTTENNYTNPGSTATKVCVLFGKIWNFIGRLRTSWQTTPDDTHFPSEKLVKDSLDGKQDKFVAVVGTTIFNAIKTAWDVNQDIVAMKAVSNTETALFQLVKTEYNNGQVSKFVFQRSYPMAGASGSLLTGQLEQWSITSNNSWVQSFLTVEFADQCTYADTATNYNTNTGMIKAALEGKMSTFIATIPTNGGDGETTLAQIIAAYTQNYNVTAKRAIDSTTIAYYDLVKVEFANNVPTKFTFQRSYPDVETSNGSSIFVRGQLEQWTRTSSTWTQNFASVEYSAIASSAINYMKTDGTYESIQTALGLKMNAQEYKDAAANTAFYAVGALPVFVFWPAESVATSITNIIQSVVADGWKRNPSDPDANSFSRIWIIVNLALITRTIDGFAGGMTYDLGAYRCMLCVQQGTGFYRIDA